MADVIKSPKVRKLVGDIFCLLAGFCSTAFAVACILTPNGMTTSGLLGVSKILEQFIHINYSYLYYGISVAILIAAFFTLGKAACAKIVCVTLVYPNILLIFENMKLNFIQDDMFLASVFFCVFYGFGIGIVLRRGYTYGGTDTLSAILQKKVFKNFTVIKIMLVIDALILLSCAFTFSTKIALYAFINHFVSNKIMDYVMFGLGTKLYKVEIITPDYERVCDYIIKDIGRGVTVYNVVGAYTHESRIKLSCVCSPSQAMAIKRFLAQNSPTSFVEMLPVISVYAAGGKRFAHLEDE